MVVASEGVLCHCVVGVQEATVVLEGYEDEYLDDEEGGAGHMDFSAEQAISQGGLSPKDKPGASSRVRQTGRQAGRVRDSALPGGQSE